MEQTDNDTCIRWLQTLEEPQSGGYLLLRREAAKDLEEAKRGLLQACQGFEQLERYTQGAVRLAVLSAQATSNPHALDSGTLCGKLFLYLLAFRSGQEASANAEQRDSLYYENGILCDSISSQVTQVGLVLPAGMSEHPAYRLLRQAHELCRRSISVLCQIQCEPSSAVYTVLCFPGAQHSAGRL